MNNLREGNKRKAKIKQEVVTSSIAKARFLRKHLNTFADKIECSKKAEMPQKLKNSNSRQSWRLLDTSLHFSLLLSQQLCGFGPKIDLFTFDIY